MHGAWNAICGLGTSYTGETALMKTCGKLFVLALFFGLVLGAAPALAGEAGTVSCSTPDCGYHANLKIGGGMKSPSLTGYCRSTKQFVRIKLKSWEAYRDTVPACPDCPEAIQPIYDGDQVAKIPCPTCGCLTLHYKKTKMFD
jgi:hypothetical protein